MHRLSTLAKITGMASIFFASNAFCSSPASEFPFVEVVQYNANAPIEDRYTYAKLTSIKGFTASVFDGHGGDLVVRFCGYRPSMLPKI